jgi:hypothetical protein
MGKLNVLSCVLIICQVASVKYKFYLVMHVQQWTKVLGVCQCPSTCIKLIKVLLLELCFGYASSEKEMGYKTSAKHPEVKYECARCRCETPRKLSGEQTWKLTVPCVFSVYAWLASCCLQSEWDFQGVVLALPLIAIEEKNVNLL